MNERIKKFDELYAIMSASNDVEDMKLFGKVMRDAMKYMSERMPEKVDEYLDELEAIRWNNYLTKKEAEDIVKGMEPAPKWSKEQVKRSIEDMGMPTEEMPYYNWCALYTTISMIMSDSGKTLERYMFGEETEVVEKEMMEIVYHLAIDKLKDKDEVFNIRRYFEV